MVRIKVRLRIRVRFFTTTEADFAKRLKALGLSKQ